MGLGSRLTRLARKQRGMIERGAIERGMIAQGMIEQSVIGRGVIKRHAVFARLRGVQRTPPLHHQQNHLRGSRAVEPVDNCAASGTVRWAQLSKRRRAITAPRLAIRGAVA
jgi:hypothetical protein